MMLWAQRMGREGGAAQSGEGGGREGRAIAYRGNGLLGCRVKCCIIAQKTYKFYLPNRLASRSSATGRWLLHHDLRSSGCYVTRRTRCSNARKAPLATVAAERASRTWVPTASVF
jgi:hypothetical protein